MSRKSLKGKKKKKRNRRREIWKDCWWKVAWSCCFQPVKASLELYFSLLCFTLDRCFVMAWLSAFKFKWHSVSLLRQNNLSLWPIICMVLGLYKNRFWWTFCLTFMFIFISAERQFGYFQYDAKTLFPALTDILNRHQNGVYACT